MNTAFVLSWLFVRAIFASENDFLLPPPSITPNIGYATLEPYTNFQISCVSRYPITWKPFQGFTGTFQTYHVQIAENHYESMIHLLNVTHDHVGYFHCVSIRPEFDFEYSINFIAQQTFNRNINGTHGIYVYVDDPHNWLVISGLPEVIIYENEYLIITCRPTFIYTKVVLYKDDERFECHEYIPALGCILEISAADSFYGKSITCLPALRKGNKVVFNVPNRMRIRSATGLYGTRGDQLKLNCSTEFLKGEHVKITWTLPNNNKSFKENRVNMSKLTYIEHPKRLDLQIALYEITIENVDVTSDTGYYKCEMIDHFGDEVYIDILNKGDDSIDIHTPSRIYRKELSYLNRFAVWQVKYKPLHPRPTLEWYDNFDRIIASTSPYVNKYEVKTTNDYTILKIKYLNFNDSGNYTLKAYNNPLNSVERKFELIVKVSPLLALDQWTTVQTGDVAILVCNCTGYPLSKIVWTFQACTSTEKPASCEKDPRLIEEQFINTTTLTPSSQRSVLTLNTTKTGYVGCTAVNTQGTQGLSSFLEIMDMETPLQIWGLADDTKVFVGDNVTIICGATAHRFVEINWYLNNSVLQSNGDGRTLESCDTKYSYRKKISWVGIKGSHSGVYECQGSYERGSSRFQMKSLDIVVNEPQKPEVDVTCPEENYIEVLLGANFQLVCNIFASPDPIINWYKDEKLIETNERIRFSVDDKMLHVKSSVWEDDGEFKCVGKNRFGSVEYILRLTVKEKLSTAWIYGIVGLLLVLVLCTVYFFIRFRRLQGELEGNVDDINPEQPLHEQADLLPYDEKFEFKKDKLKLGKHLGAGAFGVVVKGLATGILPNEAQTTVAVKILKRTADNEQFRALVTELKIMVHLGHHLNVVNLLGAVTKNIRQRKIMVIVEYCRFGDLQSFLTKHGRHFVDQINSGNDSIDPKILAKFSRNSHHSNGGCEYDSGNSSGGMDGDNTITTQMTETSDLGVSGKNAVTSSNSSDLSMDCNNGPMRFVTTTDLICWLFQVARGMDYLASRKVLHGDLAARNILLCDDNVVKICDFGLARSTYKCSIYKKQERALVPLKWIAIESFRDRVFSTFSDVWSFGIVMWELFSLGAMPYPGIQANDELFHKISDGYRMEKPKYATQEIYDIMLNCWNYNPESRPLFSALEGRFRRLLENGVAEHYMDLNQQYVEMNAKNCKKGQPDYLPLMASPAGIAPSTCYANLAVPGYLPMKPIF